MGSGAAAPFPSIALADCHSRIDHVGMTFSDMMVTLKALVYQGI
jgi:hypothetical protein